MRLHKFFIPGPPVGDEKTIRVQDLELIHQLKNVFRYKVNDRVILLDNYGFEFLSEIVVLSKKEVTFTVVEKKENTLRASKELWLYSSIIKKDNFEWILQKGTELGVSYFVPIISERSEKKDLNFERGNKIIREAAEQSGRPILARLESIMPFEQSIDVAFKPAIAFHSTGKKFNKEIFAKEKTISVFIGPEGGWTDAELEQFKVKNIEIYSLGEQTLRAETAAIAISSLLLL